jgi:molybdate transport system substrate-binding protein
MHLRRIILVTLLCMLIMVGVLAIVRAAPAGTTLLVHAGAALRPALDELGAQFEKKTGTRIDYNYKGSGCLLPDVCVSQKGDVYVPGEQYFMQQAVDRGLVKPNSKVVATMTTVLIVQAGNPKRVKGVQDLAKPGIRLGLGDPQVVAIGRAARECLVRAKVWEGAKKNMVMSSQNVSELGNAVKMKQIDAAIIWNATAAMYNSREMAVIPIPAKYAVCSPVPAGVLKFTKGPREAQAFVDFLASDQGRRVFVAHGFGAPPKPKAPCPPGRK